MAEEIEKEVGEKPELIKGGGGIFDVEVDGKMVFSKHQTGRFPNPGEVVQRIQSG